MSAAAVARLEDAFAAPDRAARDRLCVDTTRCLAMDAVQEANSGHPGHADGDGAGRLPPRWRRSPTSSTRA